MINLIRRVPKPRIAQDALWVATGQSLSALAFLASVRVMTELLSPAEFGRLTLLLGIVSLALGLSANPRLQGLMRYYNDWRNRDNLSGLRKTGQRLVFNAVMATALIMVSGWFAFGNSLGSSWPECVLVINILLVDSIRSFELALLNSARRQCSAAILTSVDAWFRPAMAIAIIYLAGASANATTALASYAAASWLTLFLMRTVLRPEGADVSNRRGPEVISAHARLDGELSQVIRKYSLPLLPLALFGWLSGVGDRYIIAGFLNLHDAGLYGAIYGLASRPFLMLSGIIELTLRPVLYGAIASRDLALVRRSKGAFALSTGVGGLLGVVSFAAFGDAIGRLILAPNYHSAIALMPWVALGYAIYGLSNVYSRLCYAYDDTRAVLLLTAAGSISGLTVLIPAIHFGGLAGAALAVPVQFAVELALSTVLARRAEKQFWMAIPNATVEKQA